MLARGILIVGGRDAGWSELVVVLVSCALFGLLHGINAFFGQSLQTTVQQIVFATVMGASFYAIRMSTGTLVVCMLRRAAVAGPILEGEPLRVDTSVPVLCPGSSPLCASERAVTAGVTGTDPREGRSRARTACRA